MGRLMRHLKIYRAIRLIVREGSIRKAAEVLALSPSALNRSVQAFEDEMGLSIFDRIPSGVRLSTAGELLLDMIDRHLTEFDEMQSQLSNLRDGLSGTLRIGLGSDINAGLLPAAVAEFAREHPGVSVEVATIDTTEALLRRAVDLAVLTNPVTDDGVEVLHFQTVQLGAWRSVQTAGAAPHTGLWDMVEARLLLPPNGTGTRVAFKHLLRRHRLEEGVSTTLTAAQIAPHLGQSASLCIFPETIMEEAGNATLFERLPLPPVTVQITVLRTAGSQLTRSEQAFLTILQRKLDRATPPSAA